MKCDSCKSPAVWVAYAAYEIGQRGEVHPRLARYPAPMIRACNDHLISGFEKDIKSLATTAEWVVRPAKLVAP